MFKNNAAQQEKQQTNKPFFNKKISIFRVSITVGVTVLALVTIFLGILIIKQQQQNIQIVKKISMLSKNTQQAMSTIQILQQGIDNNQDSSSSNYQQILKQVSGLQQKLQSMSELDKYEYKKTISQIEDFVTMGQLYATNLHEPQVAISWLKLAKNKILWLADTRLQNLVNYIDECIYEIENNHVDDSVYQFHKQIYELQQKIESLTFVDKVVPFDKESKDSYFESLALKFKSLIKINQHNKNILYSGPYAANTAKQRVKLLLDQMFFAGLHGQSKLYNVSINELKQLILNYFDVSLESGNFFLKELNELNFYKKPYEYAAFNKLQSIVNEYKQAEE